MPINYSQMLHPRRLQTPLIAIGMTVVVETLVDFSVTYYEAIRKFRQQEAIEAKTM